MSDGLYIASSAGVKQQRKLDVVSNNLANMNTPGFKKDELVYKELEPPFQGAHRALESNRNTLLPSGLSNKEVSYVGVDAQTTNFAQGTLLKTGNPLDVALEGDGFFALDTPEGIRYSRVGNFRIDEQGQIVDKEGNPVISTDDASLLVPPGGVQITIGQEGIVSAGTGTAIQPLGQIKVVRFDNPGLLRKEGDGMYRVTDPEQRAIPHGEARVMQGFVENSNVNAVEEMSKMIQTLRTFEAYQKIIQSVDEADQQSVTSIARLA